MATSQGPLASISSFVNGIQAATDAILEFSKHVDETVKKTIDSANKIGGAWIKINDSAFKTARTMAMSRGQAQEYNDYLLKSTRQLAAVWGKTAADFAKFQEQYASAVGKNIELNKDQLEGMAHMGVISDSFTAKKFVDEFDKIGGSVEVAESHMAVLQETAKLFGVNPAKATKLMADNIKLASSYSFRNGVADIEKMALKAASMRMDMNAIMQASEKFSTIEGAINTSANIQMLGGSFAREFSNPMGVMYESLADPAAFQERILRTVGGKGRYNEKSGTVEFDPVTLMLMRETAKQLGMSVDQITNPAAALIQDQKVEEELRSAGNFSGWEDTDLEAIKNLSRNNFDAKTGKHFVNVVKNGKVEKTYLEDLNKEQLKAAQDSVLTEETMQEDVRVMRQILEESRERAKGTISLNDTMKGLKQMWEGIKSWIQSIWMPLVDSIYKFVSKFLGGLFADGGIVEPAHAAIGTIVPGDSYSGDKTPVMANAGEMIINTNQQKSLFSFIKSLTATGVKEPTQADMTSSNAFDVDAVKAFTDHLKLLQSQIIDVDKTVLNAAKSTYSFKDSVFDFVKSASSTLGLKIDDITSPIKSIFGKDDKKEVPTGTMTPVERMREKWSYTKTERTIRDKHTVTPIDRLYQGMETPAFFDRLGKLDKKTGRLEYDPITFKLMREMSNSLGVSPDSLMKPSVSKIGLDNKPEIISPRDKIFTKPQDSLVRSSVSKIGLDNKPEIISTRDKIFTKPQDEGAKYTSNVIKDDSIGVLRSIDNKILFLSNKNIGVKGSTLASPSLFKKPESIDTFNETLTPTSETGNTIQTSPIKSFISNFNEVKGGILDSMLNKLSAFADGIFGTRVSNNVEPTPISGNFMGVSPTKPSETPSVSTVNLGNSDINLNVNGTIKIEGGGNSSNLYISKLIDTAEFKRTITDMILKRINENSNSGKRNAESERNNMASIYNRVGK